MLLTLLSWQVRKLTQVLSFMPSARWYRLDTTATFAVKQQMRSVQNIQKITKAMKMVAASKMRVAQASTEKSRGITQPLVTLLGDLPGKSWLAGTFAH